MTAGRTFDKQKAKAFTERVLADTSGMGVTMLAYIGDRLGLFKDLAAHGPATSAELATRTGTFERYTREWLRALTAAGYLAHDAATGRFLLPPEHRAVLAQENGRVFFGGIHQMLIGLTRPIEQVLDAFRRGGGVPQSAYDRDWWDGLERDSAVTAENLIVQQWLPQLPDVMARLQRGALVADVGCGHGRALIRLAQTYPNSRYVGYDVFAPSIQRATANAQAAGVSDRLHFEQRDILHGVPEALDVITTFDVIHDAAHPGVLLAAIRAALTPDGFYVCVDIECSDNVADNTGPLTALRYSYSVLYCMTTSLAAGGEGLGTLGLTESKMRALCADAGFRSLRKVPLKDSINAVYEARP